MTHRYTDGLPGYPDDDSWVLFVNADAPTPPPTPPTPPPPPPAPALSKGFLISRQNVLMRYMDVCSSSRVGGGADGNDFFAIKCADGPQNNRGRGRGGGLQAVGSIPITM